MEVNAETARILDANLNRAREAYRVMEEYARFVLDDGLLTRGIKEARHEFAAVGSLLEGRTVAQAEARGSDRAPAARGSETDRKVARAESFGGLQDALAGKPPVVPGDAEGDRETARAPAAAGFHSARGSVIRARDIEGDVGREAKAEGELERASVEEVARAAAKRLSEALRVIEEYGKTVDPEAARRVEGLRYRGYELERRLVITMEARRRFADVLLYVIITESLCRGDWFETAKAAIRGGADAIQLREKNLPDREFLSRATRLAELCHEHGKLFMMNDRPDVAVASGADGVHLGQEDMPVAAVRRILPTRCLIGLSTHTLEQVEAAAELAPDYIGVGPMFATATKQQEGVAGPGLLQAARRRTSLPLTAIGGIHENNVEEVAGTTGCAICVCAAVVAQEDVERAARGVRRAIEGVCRRGARESRKL